MLETAHALTLAIVASSCFGCASQSHVEPRLNARADAPALRKAPAPPKTIVAEEALRRFFAARGLVEYELETHLALIEDPSSGTCRLGQRREPASGDTRPNLKVMAVAFDRPARNCDDPSLQSLCLAIAENCLTIENGIFCDGRLLERYRLIARMTYQNAMSSLRRSRIDGEPFLVTPLTSSQLIRLSTATESQRTGHSASTSRRGSYRSVFDRDSLEPSPLLQFMEEVAVLRPVLHELAHLEQTSCAQADPDFVGLMEEAFFAGQRDFDFISWEYERLFCRAIPRNEVHADIRSIDLVLDFITRKGPAVAASDKQDVMDALLPEISKPVSLARYSRELALMTIVSSMEYEALVFAQPKRARRILVQEPDTDNSSELTAYYASQPLDIAAEHDHIDRGFRIWEQASRLDLEHLYQFEDGSSSVAMFARLVPVLANHLALRNRSSCQQPLPEANIASFAALPFDRAPARYPQIAAAARAHLARLMDADRDTQRAMVEAMRPEFADLDAVFGAEFATMATRKYAQIWSANIDKLLDALEECRGRRLIVWARLGSDIRAGDRAQLAGGWAKLADEIKPEAIVVNWELLEPGNSHGMTFDGLLFVNGKWTLAPKPWRIKEK